MAKHHNGVNQGAGKKYAIIIIPCGFTGAGCNKVLQYTTKRSYNKGIENCHKNGHTIIGLIDWDAA